MSRPRCQACGQTLNPWRMHVGLGLTARQWEYVDAFCEGLSQQETADKLFVCLKAVKWQVTAIGKALGVKGMREIADKVIRLHYDSPELKK